MEIPGRKTLLSVTDRVAESIKEHRRLRFQNIPIYPVLLPEPGAYATASAPIMP